jgi:acyl-homoserine lactone acylase PvdQ
MDGAYLINTKLYLNAKIELARWQKHADNTTIYRDDFGVPHIYGKTDADAVFGLLYAQCEDDFPRIERNYLWAIGRLAEVEGEKQLYSDVRANLFMSREEAIAQYENSPEWLKKLCDAFADGINYYLHTHPEVKPALLTRFEPWMPMYFSEGSIGGDIESISTEKLEAFYKQLSEDSNTDAVNQQEAKVVIDQLQLHQDLDEPQGSNGIAISGKLTQSGKAMLLINPHTSFYFRGEVHVVSEEGLNAYGAVTWGQFFVYQGFNEKNGWMHTSSYTDVMDEFLESVEKKDDQLYYRYGEALRPVEKRMITLSVKTDSAVVQREFPIYKTHHGPITEASSDQWIATAMLWDPSRALQQAFIRTKTASYDEFKKMMDYKTNSSNNTVYADADGNIAFFQGNFIPKRDTTFNYELPVDGSNKATDWQGLHEVDECIHLFNPGNGWIQNCNSTPFTSAAEFSPKKQDYPYYMATEPENFRGVHAIKVLTNRSGYTLDSLLSLAYDPYLPAFEKLIPGLINAYDQSGKKYNFLKPAIDVLRQWDMRTSKESVAMSLAHYYITAYLQKGPRLEGLSMMERVNYFGTQTPDDERLQIFSEAVQKITDDFGKWNTPWGEICRLQRLDGAIAQKFDDTKPSIPIGFGSGNWGALASFGMRGKQDTKRYYGTYGNSFVAVVEFGEKVKAKSILAGGQSGDRNSTHFMDQAQRYADRNFKDVAYYKEDVEARAVKKYQPGK